MKTRLTVDYFKSGDLNNYVAGLVAYSNGNDKNITIKDVHGYLKCKQSELPATLKNMKVTLDETNHTIAICEDGENLNCVIEMRELHELAPEVTENVTLQRYSLTEKV